MRVPGGNILGAALRVINPQTVQWRAFMSRTENSVGDTIPTFATAVDIEQCSMQPVDKRLYQQLGLNLAKNYSTLWTMGDVKPTAREQDGDIILFGCKTWQCESDRFWADVGEFRRILCVEVQSL